MSNQNLKYQNGLVKRAAVRALRAGFATDGALRRRSEEEVRARLGGKAHFIVDTNLVFALIEYWADELRHGLRELCAAQPTLRLYLLDTVASECRGTLEKRARYDDIVYDGRNAERAFLYPLRAHSRTVDTITSALTAARPPSASDRKDYLIAAAAIAYDMSVVTANESDFAAIAALDPRLRYLPLRGERVEARTGELFLAALAAIYRHEGSPSALR
jgi:predicted nucleic acid-binding protein